jgi:uncharacterized Zn finger protein (UPF0148 family)
MSNICPTCGCPTEQTSYGRTWCPVCFKAIEEEEPTDDDHSYIG